MSARKEFELTYPQKSIWVTEQYYSGTNINNICATLTIKEDVDLEKLNKAINLFLKNNKSFSLNFKMKEGRLVQYFTDWKNIDFEVLHLKDYDEVKKKTVELSNIAFDIESERLFDYKVFKLENGYGGFIIIAHHIISDAATFSLMGTEIVENYSKLKNNEEISFKEYSYEDYIESEQEYKESEKFLKDKEYWEKLYETIPEVATVPSIKNNNSNNLSCAAEREEYIIEKELLNKIVEFCKNNKISNYNFFMAIYAIYIGRVSNLNDFVIGTPILNRTNFKEKHTTGMFINTAPLRIKIEENIDFVTFAKQIAQSSLSMLRYQKFPYQMLLENLRKKDSTMPTLFDVMLSYQVTKANDRTLEIPYEVEWLPTSTISDSLYIHLHDNDDNGTLNVAYDYQIDKYSFDDIQNMHKRVLHIIEQVLSNENCLECDIEIVTEEEKNKILYEFNNTKADYPKDKTVVDLFEEQVNKTPDNVAVVCGEQKLTYRELNEKANALAWYLKEQGVKAEEPISVLLDRKINLIISIMAILKCGAIYLPIDVESPEERIKYIIKNSNTKVLLTEIEGSIDIQKVNKINLNKFEFIKYPKENLKTKITSNDTIYIIYTSGSTGNPKGVKISNKNLNNFVNTFTSKFGGVDKNDKCLAATNVAFDVSIFEIFTTLLNGAQLFLYEENTIKDIFKYCKNIEDNKITFLYMPPNILDEVYKILSKNRKAVINKMLIGVEPIKSTIIKKYYELNENMKIINAYGPTETTICATANILNKKEIENYSIIPIGKPIGNTRLVILDKNLRLTPIGIQGELYISGDCVGNGYINNQQKNLECFIKKIKYFEDEIAYKTGDIVRWNNDGTISYIGRQDNQVKINGHRIELGEIESAIYHYKNIDKVVVIMDNNKKIYAYFTSKYKIDIDDLRRFLNEKLLKYFVPNFFVQIEKFNITRNGKIDKKGLLENKIENDKKIILPKNELENKLKQIFEKTLTQENISIDDNFFELGGDSLSAIKLVTKIYDEFNVQIGIKHVFDNPSVEELAKVISSLNGIDNLENKIFKVEKSKYYPTSSAQKRMYYASAADGENSILYNIAGGLILDKKPDIQKLNNCFNELIRNNETLRTYFEVENGEIVQKIQDEVKFEIGINKSNKSDVNEIAEDFIKPFDLAKAPLIRAQLTELRNGKILFLIDMHHIIGDGETIKIIAKEISDLYNGRNLNKKDIDYKDFAAWENKNEFKKQENYWLSVYEDKVPVLELPTNYSRPAVQSFEGKSIIKKLNKDIVNTIEETCKILNITPYMLLISVYYILLSEYAASNDIIIGTPVVGRNKQQLHNIIGMFVNTLPIRNEIKQEESFGEFVTRVKDNCLKAFENQEYPLDKLIKKLNIHKDTSRNAFFDVLFTYQNGGYPVMNFENINAKYYIPETNIAKFDLSLEAILGKKELSLRFEYCTKLFTEDFINKLSKHYINILKEVLKNINIKISDIDMISREEKRQILNEINNTQTEYERDKTVVQLFEEQVHKTPDSVAVVYKNKKLTYKELNEKSNQLANYIICKYKVRKHDKIAIFMKKSLESIISILAIIKAGAVFVPIDIEYPEERIDYILSDSKAKLILTVQENEKILKTNTKKLSIDIDNFIYKSNDIKNPENQITPADLIYIMYTSGSTGKPKGVMVSHINVVRLVRNTNYIDFSKCKRILQTGSIVFDACTFEIWGALLNGLRLYIIKKMELLDTNILEKYLIRNKIDTLWLTAPLFNQLSEENPYIFKEVKYILTGGDILSPKHINLVREANPKITIINGYGPTENTTFSCCFTIDKKYEKNIPIGRAISNSTVYVVSRSGKILPKGIPGELWVGGDGVAKGYLNRKELTNEKFIKNPFGKGKIYKTGDCVRLLSDGNIQFIGRFDNQVKIRGFRVEPSEINNVLKQYPKVSKIYTIVKEINGSKVLITYFTAESIINTQDILFYLKEKLPFYMIPKYLIQVDEFPLTINGKVDTSKLPAPQSQVFTTYIPPENDVQEQLCKIWCKVFNLEKVSIQDNFFDLGGDSLLAIRLQTEALKSDININYSDIFEYQTIKRLSEKKQDKQLYKIDEKYDYSKINGLIEKNDIKNIETNNKEVEIGNLLLLGATGFLGAHILNEYLSTTKGNVYCLVRRKNNEDSEIRLKNLLNFYFDRKYDNEFRKRIFVIYGDITKEKFGLDISQYEQLADNIELVINSAAFVKHFGDFKTFNSVNVLGTKNIIKFCKNFNKKLYHVSTMSVAGMSEMDHTINGDEERIPFSEKNFFVNQNLRNAYVYTKFQAEKEILEEIPNGLKACILRMGNIFNRYSDGKFQINVSENAYINRIKALIKLGAIQKRFMKHALEFTPVDSASKAIMTIIRHNCSFSILHIFNTNIINLPNVIDILNNLGYNIELVNDKEFSSLVKKYLKDEELKNQISGIIPDLKSDKTLAIIAKTLPDANFTTMYLNSIGFYWPEIDSNYIEQFFNYFKRIGYME